MPKPPRRTWGSSLCTRRDRGTAHLNPNPCASTGPGRHLHRPPPRPSATSSSRNESKRPTPPKIYLPNSTAKQSTCSQLPKDTRYVSRRRRPVSSMRTRIMFSLRRPPRSAGSSVERGTTPLSSNSPQLPDSGESSRCWPFVSSGGAAMEPPEPRLYVCEPPLNESILTITKALPFGRSW